MPNNRIRQFLSDHSVVKLLIIVFFVSVILFFEFLTYKNTLVDNDTNNRAKVACDVRYINQNDICISSYQIQDCRMPNDKIGQAQSTDAGFSFSYCSK